MMNDIDSLSLRSLLEHAHIGVVIHNWDTSIAYANPTALQLLRLSQEQILGKDAMDPHWHFIDDANRPLAVADFPVNKVKRTLTPLRNEVLGVVDGSTRDITWVQVNAYADLVDDPDSGFIVVSFNDISDRKQNFSFEEILLNTQDIVIVTQANPCHGPQGPRIVYVNSVFELVTGYSAAEVIGKTPRILQGEDTCRETTARIAAALQAHQPVREQLLNYSKTGEAYWLDMSIIPLRNKYGEVTHFAATERDISEQIYHAKQLEQSNSELRFVKENLEQMVLQRTQALHEANHKLERLAYFDFLTQLPNRRSFIEQARQSLSRARREEVSLVVGLVDIDHFKQINDTFGHDAGDLVLQTLATTMGNVFRQEDVFGRYGGEEFAFVLLSPMPSFAMQIAERLRRNVAGLAVVSAEGESMSVTISVGLCYMDCLHLQGARVTLEQALKQADIALYQAKEQGRNRVCVYLEDAAAGDSRQ
jgi:diguanylate cyclase (GGDEF)-like protein/PAS domain S-box-containing protein